MDNKKVTIFLESEHSFLTDIAILLTQGIFLIKICIKNSFIIFYSKKII